MGLLAQRGTVNQEQNPLKAVGGEETVDHAQNSTGLAGAGSHGNQCGLLAVNDCLFRSLDSPNLIITEIQPILIPEQIIG